MTDKKEALKVLLKHTDIFSDEIKAQILLKLDDMSEEDIQSIGKFLALATKESIEKHDQIMQNLDEFEAKLQELEQNELDVKKNES